MKVDFHLPGVHPDSVEKSFSLCHEGWMFQDDWCHVAFGDNQEEYTRRKLWTDHKKDCEVCGYAQPGTRLTTNEMIEERLNRGHAYPKAGQGALERKSTRAEG